MTTPATMRRERSCECDVVTARMVALVASIARAYHEEDPDIVRGAPVFERRRRAATSSEVLRIRLRVWPGQDALIQSAFKQELEHSLQTVVPTCADWMVTVTFEDRPIPPPAG